MQRGGHELHLHKWKWTALEVAYCVEMIALPPLQNTPLIKCTSVSEVSELCAVYECSVCVCV